MAFRLANMLLSLIINHFFDFMAWELMMRAGYFEALLYLSTVNKASYGDIVQNVNACIATKAEVIKNLRIFRFIERIVENDPTGPTRPYYILSDTGRELLELMKNTEKYKKK